MASNSKRNNETNKKGAIIVIDPVTSGVQLAESIHDAGYEVIYVFSEVGSPILNMNHSSKRLSPKILYLNQKNPDQKAEYDYLVKKIQKIVQAPTVETQQRYSKRISTMLSGLFSNKLLLLAVLPGAETGVELADKLSVEFALLNNGTALSEARRNKYEMQKRIGREETGLRSVIQCLAYSEDEVIDFFNRLDNAKCVVKPNKSAGTDSVFLCQKLQQALDAYSIISNSKNKFDHANEGVLCQEFLEGDEYVVDALSLPGEFKVTAIWRYDKRNLEFEDGTRGFFVYFGMFLADPKGEVEKEIIEYAEKVVKELGIKYGPTHMEVKYDKKKGPCLVEVGSRCHGGSGTWLPIVNESIGYNQIDLAINCYVNHEKILELPETPNLLNFGCEVHLVSSQIGRIKAIPGLNIIKKLESFRNCQFPNIGDDICLTVDCFSRPGSVQLVAPTMEKLTRDYNTIRELEAAKDIFVVEKQSS